MIRSQASSVTWAGPASPPPIPTLLWSMSTRPWASTVARTSALQSASRVASASKAVAAPPLVVRVAGGDAEVVQAVVNTDAEGRFEQPFLVDRVDTSGRRLEVRVQLRGAEFAEVPLADLAGQTRVDVGDVLMPVDPSSLLRHTQRLRANPLDQIGALPAACRASVRSICALRPWSGRA